VGLTGFKDPWNRRCYPWGREDQELFNHFRILGNIRKENSESFEKELNFIFAREGTVAYERGNICVVVNSSEKDVAIPVNAKELLFTTGKCTMYKEKIIVSPKTALIMKK